MITELQTAVIELFEAANEGEGAYMKQIKPYGGEMKDRGKNVNATPSLYIDVPLSGELTADDTMGELLSGDIAVDLLLFDNNRASGSAKYSTLAAGMNWVVKAMQGKTITVNDCPVVMALKLRWKAFTDAPIPVAIITPTLTVQEV